MRLSNILLTKTKKFFLQIILAHNEYKKISNYKCIYLYSSIPKCKTKTTGGRGGCIVIFAFKIGAYNSNFIWLMIAYIALFSALLSRLTAPVCGSMWVTSFWKRVFLSIHRSGVLTVLTWLVPNETAAVSAQVLCTPYNHAPCHFMQSHIHKVYECLAVTCPLHIWQNDRGLLHATAVTWGWNRYRNKSTESRPWRRKLSHRSCRDSNPRPFNHKSGALTTELSQPLFSFICELGWNQDRQPVIQSIPNAVMHTQRENCETTVAWQP